MQRRVGPAGVFLGIALAFFMAAEAAAADKAARRSSAAVRVVGPIKTDPRNWIATQVDKGANVYLSANYLFQVMKLRSQTTLIAFEAETLYPSLVKAFDNMRSVSEDADALTFVEVVRKLLDPAAAVDQRVDEAVQIRLAAFDADGGNLPRGHYTASEELKRYFRAMQFLSKATFDVNVNKQWFSERTYLLFPFETAVTLLHGLLRPEHKPDLDTLERVHGFYTALVGPPDLPTFHDLLAEKMTLTIGDLVAYAELMGLPKINADMGVGIQCLGERFTFHESVIEKFSDAFLDAPDVDRATAERTLDFKNVFLGTAVRGKPTVEGIKAFKADVSDDKASFYDFTLAAILKLPLTQPDKFALNDAGACVTSLTEETLLLTKQKILVPKSGVASQKTAPKSVKIFVQPGIGEFLVLLRKAEEKLRSACNENPSVDFYEILIKASADRKPILSRSEQGAKVVDVALRLPRDPTVTADVFNFSGRSDKAYLQWAVAPFEVEYLGPLRQRAKGMIMVFFQGWNDTAAPESQTPMTNEAWRELVAKGEYRKFRSLVKVP